MECFERWHTRHIGLFTFAHSVKHVSLYQRFDFWPGHLTAIMAKQVENAPKGPWIGLSGVPAAERQAVLDACRELTDRIRAGLDVGVEILSVANQELGETVLLWNGSSLDGFAVCHAGPATEAGSDTCFIKFAAARPGAGAETTLGRLLDACNEFARARGVSRVVAGVNTARIEAYRALLERGFRTDLQGVAMHRRGDAGYHRPGVFVLDDWR
jgi:hypothetical protein